MSLSRSPSASWRSTPSSGPSASWPAAASPRYLALASHPSGPWSSAAAGNGPGGASASPPLPVRRTLRHHADLRQPLLQGFPPPPLRRRPHGKGRRRVVQDNPRPRPGLPARHGHSALASTIFLDLSQSDPKRGAAWGRDKVKKCIPGTILIWDPVFGQSNADRNLIVPKDELEGLGWTGSATSSTAATGATSTSAQKPPRAGRPIPTATSPPGTSPPHGPDPSRPARFHTT